MSANTDTTIAPALVSAPMARRLVEVRVPSELRRRWRHAREETPDLVAWPEWVRRRLTAALEREPDEDAVAGPEAYAYYPTWVALPDALVRQLEALGRRSCLPVPQAAGLLVAWTQTLTVAPLSRRRPAPRARRALSPWATSNLSLRGETEETIQRAARVFDQPPAGLHIPDGAALKAKRERLELSQRDAAAAVDVSRGLLCDLESGRRDHWRTRQRVGRALDALLRGRGLRVAGTDGNEEEV